MTEPVYFVRRSEVLRVLHILGVSNDVMAAVGAIPSFPAPNPEERDGRNIMGQTEAEFWEQVDR